MSNSNQTSQRTNGNQTSQRTNRDPRNSYATSPYHITEVMYKDVKGTSRKVTFPCTSEPVALVGPPGSGKSTLIEAIRLALDWDDLLDTKSRLNAWASPTMSVKVTFANTGFIQVTRSKDTIVRNYTSPSGEVAPWPRSELVQVAPDNILYLSRKAGFTETVMKAFANPSDMSISDLFMPEARQIIKSEARLAAQVFGPTGKRDFDDLTVTDAVRIADHIRSWLTAATRKKTSLQQRFTEAQSVRASQLAAIETSRKIKENARRYWEAASNFGVEEPSDIPRSFLKEAALTEREVYFLMPHVDNLSCDKLKDVKTHIDAWATHSASVASLGAKHVELADKIENHKLTCQETCAHCGSTYIDADKHYETLVASLAEVDEQYELHSGKVAYHLEAGANLVVGFATEAKKDLACRPIELVLTEQIEEMMLESSNVDKGEMKDLEWKYSQLSLLGKALRAEAKRRMHSVLTKANGFIEDILVGSEGSADVLLRLTESGLYVSGPDDEELLFPSGGESSLRNLALSTIPLVPAHGLRIALLDDNALAGFRGEYLQRFIQWVSLRFDQTLTCLQEVPSNYRGYVVRLDNLREHVHANLYAG